MKCLRINQKNWLNRRLNNKNLKNYTSSVPVLDSISRIEFRLSQAGATHIGKTYVDQKPVGIMFQIDVNGMPMSFKLPAKPDKVFEYMIKQKKQGFKDNVRETTRLQADRTAWKILSDWVEIQISLIELDQAEPMEVFMQYLYDGKKDKTLYEIAKGDGFKMLTSGGK